MTRSFPEKTFEHWCSMHLSYRYRAKMLMWWPSSGADLDVVHTPQTWGKRFWLELKTTEWNASKSRHDLFVDLVQLSKYGQQPIPDYYVFPQPPWYGVLGPSTASAWLGPRLAPERLAYESWSGEKWFTQWTWVVPGQALRKVLNSEINALPAGATKKNYRIASVHNGAISWRSRLLSSLPLSQWRDFWAIMDRCGNSQWPSQFLLPPDFVPALVTPRADLVSSLGRLATDNRDFSGVVVRYNYQGDGDSYVAQTDGQVTFPEFTWGQASRAIIALNEHALAQ